MVKFAKWFLLNGVPVLALSDGVRIDTIGVYPLALIRRRKGSWLHVGSIPTSPTQAADHATDKDKW